MNHPSLFLMVLILGSYSLVDLEQGTFIDCAISANGDDKRAICIIYKILPV